MRLVYIILIGLWLIPIGLLLYGCVLINLTQLGSVYLGIFLINIAFYGFIVMTIIASAIWFLILRKENAQYREKGKEKDASEIGRICPKITKNCEVKHGKKRKV